MKYYSSVKKKLKKNDNMKFVDKLMELGKIILRGVTHTLLES